MNLLAQFLKNRKDFTCFVASRATLSHAERKYINLSFSTNLRKLSKSNFIEQLPALAAADGYVFFFKVIGTTVTRHDLFFLIYHYGVLRIINTYLWINFEC